MFWYDALRKYNNISAVFLPEISRLNSTMRKHQTQFEGNSTKQLAIIHERKGKTCGTLSKLKETKVM